MTEKKQIFISILSIIFLIIIFQNDSLHLGMHGDDYVVFRSYSGQELLEVFYKNLLDYNEGVALSAYRPLYRPMFHFAYKIFGFNPYKLHIMLVILQILQTVLAFLFFRMLTQNNTLALVSSLLFPLNPNLSMHFTWNTEISASSGMIPLILSLMALVSYIRKPRNSMIFFNMFFALLAYLTKETYAPLFFLSVLTLIFYKKDKLREYSLIIGLQAILFAAYLGTRFAILHEWGGQGITPDNYSGIARYFGNYTWFLGQISLFNHYIAAGPVYVSIYIIVIVIFLTALIRFFASLNKVSRKVFLYICLLLLAVQSFWLLRHVDAVTKWFHMEPRHIKGILIDSRLFLFYSFLYLMQIYIIITLAWPRHGKESSSNESSSETSSHLMKDPVVTFFSYSFMFMLFAGLPMFFFPESRIMNVSALGTAGIFGSAVFMALSVIRENRLGNILLLGKNGVLFYFIILVTSLFILSNGLLFRYNYAGPESYSKDSTDVMAYVMRYSYFVKHNLTEHGAYLFNYLVSKGLVDKESGMLNREKVKTLYPEVVECMSEERLFNFKPSDSTIYPFAGFTNTEQ